MHHELKLQHQFKEAKLDGRKPWEWRSTEDRRFEVGDTVCFHMVFCERKNPTGLILGPVTITYVHSLGDGHVIFTHTPIPVVEAVKVELACGTQIIRATNVKSAVLRAQANAIEEGHQGDDLIVIQTTRVMLPLEISTAHPQAQEGGAR